MRISDWSSDVCSSDLSVQAPFGAPEVKRVAERPLERHSNVLEAWEMWEHRRDLERAHHAHAGNPGGPLPGDVSPFEDDQPPCRLEEFRQEIEDRRFAGAVRADHRMDDATPDAEVDAIDGNKAGERSERKRVVEGKWGEVSGDIGGG